MKFFDGAIKKTFISLVCLLLLLLVGAVVNHQFIRPTLTSSQQVQLTVPKNFIVNPNLGDSSQSKQVASAPQAEESAENTPQTGAVLGTEGEISFSTSNNYSSNEGVLVLNAQIPAQVTLSSYQISGMGNFKLYKVTKNELLNYLLYRRGNEEYGTSGIEKLYKFDTNSVPVDKSFDQQITADSQNRKPNVLSLPIDGTGIWMLEGTVNGAHAESLVIRTNLAAVIHKGDNQNVFWVQDTNYASVPDASVELINAENSITSLGQFVTNQDGLVTDNPNDSLDIALVSKGDDITILPVNLSNFNYRTTTSSFTSYSFSQRRPDNKTFLFTDRFLYKPGDTVNFKAIIRTDDDADYSISPKTVNVTFGGYDNPFWQKNMPVSELGTIDGSIIIPKDAKADYYSLNLQEGDTYLASTLLQVANYRKPDASVNVTTDKLMYLPGEKMTVNISGTSFLGQPIRNQEVRYKVYEVKAEVGGDYTQATFSTSDAGYYGKNPPITEGKVTLDRKGKASFDLTAKNTSGYRQFWIINIEYLDAGGTAATDAVRALLQPGDFIIESAPSDSRYYQNKEGVLPIKLSKNKIDAKIDGITVTASLMVGTSNNQYVVEQDGLSAVSDGSGKLSFTFTPKQSASYRLDMQARDAQNNLIKDEESIYLSSVDIDTTIPTDIFDVTTDKKQYNIGDTAKVSISTRPEIKNVFVSVGRSYSRGYRVLPVTDGKASFEFPVVEKYQPNVYIFTGSFLDDQWKYDSTNIEVNTADKKVSLNIKPAQSTYGPAETASFEITATDGQGKPVATDLAFWVFDKALLELHGNYFEGIFENFWQQRGFWIPTNYSYEGITSSGSEGGGGCFAGETLITMADGSTKRIDQVKIGDNILTFSSSTTKEKVAAKVLGTHEVNVSGYLIINGALKITPEHKLLVNNQWKTAGEIEVGDSLLKDDGSEQKVTSIEWVRGKFPVYNLRIEKFHTFFAGDIYVHNDKGDVRSVFKDTAYWNPHVTTGEDGKATVTVKLPDNLTTWVAAAVSANAKTQVGDGKTEIIVTKDIVFRPVFPAFLRTGDHITLTALLNNFTKQKEKFSTEATLSGGELSNAQQSVTVGSEDLEELSWPVVVTGKNEEATFTVKAKGETNSSLVDQVTEKLPIYEYGSWMAEINEGKDTVTLPLQLSAGTDVSKAEAVVTLRASKYPEFATTLKAQLARANQYDVEGNSSALIAASIAKKYGAELGLSYSQAVLNQAVQTAVAGLIDSAGSQGFWEGSQRDQINPSKTRFALEGLIAAKDAGFAVDEAFLNKSIKYITDWQPSDPLSQVEQQYIFSLLPNRQLNRKKLVIDPQADPALTARAALANKRQGFVSTEESSVLTQIAQQTPTQLGWKDPFDPKNIYYNDWGRVATPTSWGTRAVQELAINSLDAGKALEYLYRNDSYSPEQEANMLLATVKYYADTQQLSPNYQYKVFAGDAQIAEGSVSSAQQVIKPIEINRELLANNAALKVEKTGAGALFTQLEKKQFYTDPAQPAQAHNISVTRKYLSTKPTGKPTEVGDMVIVQFTVDGLGLGETAIQIQDYLPSGLVAIDESLDNGTFDNNAPTTTPAVPQITDQGMQLTFQTIATNGTYSYKTRVISEGIFRTPPAVVKLTNQPSIWASTPAETLVIDGKSTLTSLGNGAGQEKGKVNINVFSMIALGIFVIGIAAVVLAYRFRTKIRMFIQRLNRRPPTQPPVVPPQPDVPPTQSPPPSLQ